MYIYLFNMVVVCMVLYQWEFNNDYLRNLIYRNGMFFLKIFGC